MSPEVELVPRSLQDTKAKTLYKNCKAFSALVPSNEKNNTVEASNSVPIGKIGNKGLRNVK